MQDFCFGLYFQSGRIILSSRKSGGSPLYLIFKLAYMPDNRQIKSLGTVNFTDPPKRQVVAPLMCCFRNCESPYETNAGPWAFLVGEPFVVPWSVHSDGTCRSRTLICYVVPSHISLLRRRLIHVCIYLTQVPSHRFFDSSLSRTAVHLFLRKISFSRYSFDCSTCREIVVS